MAGACACPRPPASSDVSALSDQRLIAEQSVQTQAGLVQSVKLLDGRSEELKVSVRELSEMVRSLNQRLEAAEAARRRTQEEIGGLSRPAAPPPVVTAAVQARGLLGAAAR